MAIFRDLPAEIVHLIDKYLTPTCREEYKQNILNFCLVQNRTWIIANEYTFPYMTLYSSDPNHESRLGIFACSIAPDSDGLNVRDLVKEVRVVMPPEVSTVHVLDYPPSDT
jgi:hypothetical protein